MRPLPLAAGAALTVYLLVRRRRLGRIELAGGVLVAAACVLVGLGVVPVPDVVGIVEDVGQTLGPYTYLAVGALAFLETGAFVGLVAPGETAVLVGGVVAGQGEISPVVLIAVVWACAVAGDVTSYTLGRRLGRGFLLRHGGRLKITEARLEQVERFLEKRGGVTILIGRFIGLVRALAPFIAGTARMPLRKFLPYDVLGAGLWASLFVMLGYVFWRSLDMVTQYVGRGLLVFALLVGIVAAVLAVRRLQRDPEARARAVAWAEGQPLVRPLLPLAARAAGPARFAYERLTPGHLGLELTTLLALLAVGAFGFFALADALDGGRRVFAIDREALDLARRLGSRSAEGVAERVTDLGALPVVAVLTALTAVWAIVRRHALEAAAIVAGLGLTIAASNAAKAAIERPRPAEELVAELGFGYPSGHSAYAVGLVACAVVLARAESGPVARFFTVGVALGLMVVVGVTRIYLRVHYFSDVLGGFGLAAGIYAACGIVAVVVAFIRHNGRA